MFFKNKHNNMNNFYEQNFNSVNRYMFIFLNIFVLYFFPYLYFISYIVILYQRLDVDFNIRISNNRLSIDKLVFKNVQDDVVDEVQDDVVVVQDDDVKIMRKFFDILKNKVEEDDDSTSVVNCVDINNTDTIDSILDTIQ